MIATPCANESALRIHLRTVDQEDRRITAIENRAAQLLLSEYSDSRTDNVQEAMGEMSESIADCIAIHIGYIGNKRCSAEKAMHYEAIGRMVAGMISAYCEAEAKRQAENEINNATCWACWDEGYCKCDPIGD
jgi:urocanate hydratase